MELSFQPTAGDYRQAFHAHRERTAATRWFWRISYILLAVILILPLAKQHPRAENFVTPLALIGMVLAIVVFLPHRAAKQMITDKGASALSRVEISGEGIRSQTALSDSKLSWDMVSKWIENRSVFVVYLSPVSFFPIPKRAMTETQISELRELLNRHVRR